MINSYPCKKCGQIYTEESGAYKGFICENCQVWYEIYEIDNRTRTLEIAETLTEAKNIYRKYLRSGLWTNKKLGIDKWQNVDNLYLWGV